MERRIAQIESLLAEKALSAREVRLEGACDWLLQRVRELEAQHEVFLAEAAREQERHVEEIFALRTERDRYLAAIMALPKWRGEPMMAASERPMAYYVESHGHDVSIKCFARADAEAIFGLLRLRQGMGE